MVIQQKLIRFEYCPIRGLIFYQINKPFTNNSRFIK